jgi:hypothetical protein
MQHIADWLKTGTYEQGVQLYEQHGSNSFLKTKFKAGANDYNVAKLREELGKMAESCELKVEGNGPAPVEPIAEPPNADSAKKYLQLCKKRDRLYLELNVLMEQKHHLPDGDELKQCAFAILTWYQKIRETWVAIDYYNAHGTFPAEEVIPDKKDIAPKKEMQLLRQTISKAVKRLESPTCRDRAKTETLLAISRNNLARLVTLKKQPDVK